MSTRVSVPASLEVEAHAKQRRRHWRRGVRAFVVALLAGAAVWLLLVWLLLKAAGWLL